MDSIKNILGTKKNILGTKPKKRKCRVCGQVHIGMPFTDCYSEKENGLLPDDLQGYYRRKFRE